MTGGSRSQQRRTSRLRARFEGSWRSDLSDVSLPLSGHEREGSVAVAHSGLDLEGRERAPGAPLLVRDGRRLALAEDLVGLGHEPRDRAVLRLARVADHEGEREEPFLDEPPERRAARTVDRDERAERRVEDAPGARLRDRRGEHVSAHGPTELTATRAPPRAGRSASAPGPVRASRGPPRGPPTDAAAAEGAAR